jgi:FAD/FMN-containing dehydrogenase
MHLKETSTLYLHKIFQMLKEVKRYDDFMNDVVHSVAVKYQGSLKAEHGTGEIWLHLLK